MRENMVVKTPTTTAMPGLKAAGFGGGGGGGGEGFPRAMAATPPVPPPSSKLELGGGIALASLASSATIQGIIRMRVIMKKKKNLNMRLSEQKQATEPM